MGVKDLELAFDLIDEFGGDFEGEKPSTLIKKAEKELGLVFPPSYKAFLSKYGCGDIEGLEFYGLIGEDFQNSGIPDAIWLTLEQRKLGLPEYLVLVYATGDGVFIALNTRDINRNGEGAVIAYDTNGNTAKVAEGFGEFLLAELKTVLP